MIAKICDTLYAAVMLGMIGAVFAASAAAVVAAIGAGIL